MSDQNVDEQEQQLSTSAPTTTHEVRKRHNCPECGSRLFFREAIPASEISCVRCGYRGGSGNSPKRKPDKNAEASAEKYATKPVQYQPIARLPANRPISGGWAAQPWSVGDGLRFEYWGVGLIFVSCLLLIAFDYYVTFSAYYLRRPFIPPPLFRLGGPLLIFVAGNVCIIIGRRVCYTQGGRGGLLMTAMWCAFLCPLLLVATVALGIHVLSNFMYVALEQPLLLQVLTLMIGALLLLPVIGMVCLAFHIAGQKLGLESYAWLVSFLLLAPFGAAILFSSDKYSALRVCAILMAIVGFLGYIRLIHSAAREMG